MFASLGTLAKMHRNVTFKLSSLFVVTYIVAICMSKNLPAFTFFVMLEPIVIWTVVTILIYGIPQEIAKASQNNCYRMDGTLSDRRSELERHFMAQVRRNLYFVLINIALVSNWLFLVVDNWSWIENMNSDNATVDPMTALAATVLLWLVACFGLLYYSFFASLRTLNTGISSRAENYLSLDVENARRQFEHEYNKANGLENVTR